jgi:hypothetical protein
MDYLREVSPLSLGLWRSFITMAAFSIASVAVEAAVGSGQLDTGVVTFDLARVNSDTAPKRRCPGDKHCENLAIRVARFTPRRKEKLLRNLGNFESSPHRLEA